MRAQWDELAPLGIGPHLGRSFTFTGHDTQTIPVAASQPVTQQGVAWGQLMATGTIILLPMVICGVAIRRWLVRGLTMGAMSGQ